MVQTLTRQLAESRDSLHYSNQLYEQLEVKLEESEESNKQLQKLCRTSQALVEKNTTSLRDLEKELTQLKEERMELRAELDKLRKDADLAREKEWERRKSRSPGKEKTPEGQVIFDEDSVDDDTVTAEAEEVARLRSTVRDLSTKLQSSVTQKRQLEREMEELLVDNAGLSQTLEKMGVDMSLLQLRLEEAQERSVHLLEGRATAEVTSPIAISPQSLSLQSTAVCTSKKDMIPTVVVTPDTSHTTPPPTNTASTSTMDTTPERTPEHTPEHTPECNPEHTPESDSIAETSNGHSIFSELDREYSSLQQQYKDLLTNCVCSASQSQQVKGGDDKNAKKSVSKSSVSSGGEAFKELFDEVFATLRQTALVADRLIEGRLNSRK